MAKEKANQTSASPALSTTQQNITQNSTSNLYGNAFVQQQMNQGASNMSLGAANMSIGGGSSGQSQTPSNINTGGSKATNPGGSAGGSSGGGIQRGTGPIIESLFSPDYMVDPNQSTNVLVQGSNLSNNGQINWDANWHGPNGFQKKTPTPQVGPNINVPFNFGEINPLRPHDRIRLDVTARASGDTDSESREFIVRPDGGNVGGDIDPIPGGGGGGGQGSDMRVFHDFDNNANKDISLTYTGDIQSVVSESKPAPDGLFSTDMSAKHYRIKMNSNYENISITEPGSGRWWRAILDFSRSCIQREPISVQSMVQQK